ncbi:hypothetical protein VIGAN_04321200 [Vigna angularis var. angularis]|uniref:Retrovirus-related Pol polyprotein from transposon TNT 1-94-like beta-barrel domain-containing protein n=1 Tax=Vigna angularis var. angularis TaxID=157739 RepID=A0A0S3RYG6_PHAAN|nr:hypothetical protein VIGAN_04321200 [Vigna angularis var. angularis]
MEIAQEKGEMLLLSEVWEFRSRMLGWRRAKNKPKTQVNMALDKASSSDSETMLMAKTDAGCGDNSSWYLDSGCSTHMTERRDWFIKIKEASSGKIRFADDSSLVAEGLGVLY